jgi:hypothetical protein
MIWTDCIIKKSTTSGQDSLGNPIQRDPVILWSGKGRFTNWTDLELKIEDRTITKDEQAFVIPVPYETIKDAEKAVMNDVEYVVNDKYDLSPRWSVLKVKVYKS